VLGVEEEDRSEHRRDRFLDAGHLREPKRARIIGENAMTGTARASET